MAAHLSDFDQEQGMTIQEFATLTGLTVHTLRYYEQIGLLDQIQRAASGHRIYQKQDLQWVDFIKKLKATGMPLREIQQYADLRKQGNDTLQARQHLLEQHAEALQQQLAEQQAHLVALQDKIAFYQQELAKQRLI